MPWSTAQIADLAGVTVKAVRHYHSIGVLDEPARSSNGYKRYGVPHLVRVLQIKRLSDLGVPLGQIAEVSRAQEQPAAVLRVIDSELEGTIARLERIRRELSTLLSHGGTTDVPSGFDEIGPGLSSADRAVLFVSSRVLDAGAMDDLRTYLRDGGRTDAEDVFDSLAPDAPPVRIEQAAELLRGRVSTLRTKYPWMVSPVVRAPRGEWRNARALEDAVTSLYNPAQREVLRRVAEMLASSEPEDPPADP